MLHFTISIYALTKFIPKVSLYPLSINVYTKGEAKIKLVISCCAAILGEAKTATTKYLRPHSCMNHWTP
jgi:hypothetical protein